MLILEGAQAGLSWEIILNKRDAYRAAFEDFDPVKMAAYDPARVEVLLINPGIVRNRLKVQSAVINARAFLELQARHGRFARWLWGFVDGKPVRNAWLDYQQIPAATPLSNRIAKELAQCGFKFVGSRIIYAYLQAVGVVNDHETGCFRYPEIRRMHGDRIILL